MKYPLAESRLVPVASGKPDFTKTMPIKFLATAKTIGLIPVECKDTNCQVSYKIEGTDAAFTNARWDVFSQAWIGERTSSDLMCDRDYQLKVKARYTSGAEGILNSDIHINCNSRILIEPAEKRVALGQNGIEAFKATIYDPEGRIYTLTMTNDDPAQTYLFGAAPWLEFICSGLPSGIPCEQASRPRELSNIPTSPPTQIRVWITESASSRAGNYPILFTTTPVIQGKAMLIVTAEGLSEFAAWQLAVLLLLAAAVFAAASKSTKARKRL